MRKIILLLFAISFISCQSQNKKTETPPEKKSRQDAIVQEHVHDCDEKIYYRIMMREYQDCLDAGIKKDSTIAFNGNKKRCLILKPGSMKLECNT